VAKTEPLATLVDTNVLLDVLKEESTWFEWSAVTLESAAAVGPLAINQMIYAEVSVWFDSVEELNVALPPDDFLHLDLPWSAGFLAGKCFNDYRRRGGLKRSPLPDFYIGAHAAVQNLRLLTRDARRYRTYFPTVEVFAPD
jgi:predicted nucleic acid-binding protein